MTIILSTRRLLPVLVLLLHAYTGICSVFFNVKEFGAIGDGKNLDSKAINAAIETAVESGGGTVYLPAGNYLSGSIRLKSNISLYIDQGAIIIAAPVNADNCYDEEEKSTNTIYQDHGHSHWKNSLIWGINLSNVSIVGAGCINGKNLYKFWYSKSQQNANKSISLLGCRNVIIRDLSILHGGWFAILATGVDNLTIDNLKIDTNRDGLDMDCCKNVHISKCNVNSPYDDGICLKSSYALGYVRDTENVTISDCMVSGFDEGTFLDGTYLRTKNPMYGNHPTGRIKFGTESTGGFKKITITNCIFEYCRGLALESVDGGFLEDVTISNIVMRDIVNDPIFLRLGRRMRGPSGMKPGTLRRINLNNIIVYNADPYYSCTLAGIPGYPVEDIHLSNIQIYFKGGDDEAKLSKTTPENENQYPEPGMFGKSPAYGLFVRHAKGITISDVRINLLQSDSRPGCYFEDVTGLKLHNSSIQSSLDSTSIVLKNVSNFCILQCESMLDQKFDFIENIELK